MIFKTARYWLAGKILGGKVLEEFDIAAEKKNWMKQQLDFGNTVTIEYEVVGSNKKYPRTIQ